MARTSQTGEKVVYKTTQGEVLLDGEIRVSRSGPCGILCACCDRVISCSQFEAHAGRGSRRCAPASPRLPLQSCRGLGAALGAHPGGLLGSGRHCKPERQHRVWCRAPYDNIFTMAGISLRRLAAALPSDAPIYHAEDAGE